MIGIDGEDAAQQRSPFGGAVGDEGGDRGQMQRRHMIRRRLQNLRAEVPCPIRPARRKMLRRLQHNPINSRLAHDTTAPDIRDAG